MKDSKNMTEYPEVIECSYKFFSNKRCKYFPCHANFNDLNFNCLFCFCPLYFIAQCGGNFKIIKNGQTKIKDCSNCIYPHYPNNYQEIIDKLVKFINKI